jgi:hypothetical protein
MDIVFDNEVIVFLPTLDRGLGGKALFEKFSRLLKY